jgi:hypothetical protein
VAGDGRTQVREGIAEAERLMNLCEYVFPAPKEKRPH